MAPAINDAASAKALTPNAQPWKWIQNLIKAFINKIANEDDSMWMIFVDTNPSFSIYTQIAVSGVERLLVPINADDSSKTAASARLHYYMERIHRIPFYGSWTYAKKAEDKNVEVPKILVDRK